MHLQGVTIRHVPDHPDLLSRVQRQFGEDPPYTVTARRLPIGAGGTVGEGGSALFCRPLAVMGNRSHALHITTPHSRGASAGL